MPLILQRFFQFIRAILNLSKIFSNSSEKQEDVQTTGQISDTVPHLNSKLTLIVLLGANILIFFGLIRLMGLLKEGVGFILVAIALGVSGAGILWISGLVVNQEGLKRKLAPRLFRYFSIVKKKSLSVSKSLIKKRPSSLANFYAIFSKAITPNPVFSSPAHAFDSIALIFEEAPVGIAILDTLGHIGACNKMFRQMIGDTIEINSGYMFSNLLATERCNDITKQLEEMVQGKDTEAPLEIRFSSNLEEVFSLYASRTKIGPNQHIGLMLYIFNTSEQRKLEMQFAQSQKMQAVGQLAGGIAHDFNNLLTAMIGFCDLLLLRHSPSDQSFTDIMQIKQNANRAANLVRQLLAFSRQQTLQPKLLDITEILSELSVLLRRLIGPAVELKVIHGRDLGLIKVDQGQFEQVIINLAVNARDAISSSGVLTIRTTNQTYKRAVKQGHETIPPGSYILIEVIDTGSGIQPDHLSRIFDPFFSTKAVGSGTGLGLSTVYGIVKQTGGFIWVDSQIGAGTKFSIYIPRSGAEESNDELIDVAPDAGVSNLTGTGTILIVEDEDAVRLFSARALRNKGYKVIEAQSGEEALTYLNQSTSDGNMHVDLVITDVVMPHMDGPTMVKEIYKMYPSLKVIFISGYTEDTFRQSLDEGSIVHFLPKPFSLKDLAIKVKEVMSLTDYKNDDKIAE